MGLNAYATRKTASDRVYHGVSGCFEMYQTVKASVFISLAHLFRRSIVVVCLSGSAINLQQA